jgi:copper homeostasis protein
MIRPRTGDFVYTDAEFEVMVEDIRCFRENNVQGVVFGILTPEGDVDVTRTQWYDFYFNPEAPEHQRSP